MNFSLPSFRKSSVIGLDIGSSSVKAVEIAHKSRDKGFELRSHGQAMLPGEAIVQGAFLNSSAIVDAIREAVENGRIGGKDVAAAVSGHSVIVKRVNLPQMSREELEDQIQWEAEQYIPFDVHEVHLDFQILDAREEDGQMDVLLVAAKKDLIDDYVQVIQEAGLNPIAIDVAGFAVQNAYELNYEPEPESVIALVNIGAQVVNINVLRNGIPAFTRDIMTGGAQYTEEIQKALSVSFEEAERIKMGSREGGEQVQDVIPQEVEQALRSVSDTVIGEISRSCCPARDSKPRIWRRWARCSPWESASLQGGQIDEDGDQPSPPPRGQTSSGSAGERGPARSRHGASRRRNLLHEPARE
jgi:type IV pilus assembly protein PilM